MAFEPKISPENLLPWSSMEDWVDGASSAPTGHTLSSGAVAREATIIKVGTYSAKITRSGSNALMYYDLENPSEWRGRKITMACWVYATVTNTVRISIDDGVSSQSSSTVEPSIGGWVRHTVTHNINPSATQVRVQFEVITTNGIGYFDDARLFEGDSDQLIFSTVMAVDDFVPAKSYSGQIVNVPRRLGGRIPNMQLLQQSIAVRGTIVGATKAAARTSHDILNKAINPVRTTILGEIEKKDLYIDDDRLIRVHLNRDNLKQKAAYKLRDIDLRFLSSDPFWRSPNMTRHKETISASPTIFTISTINGNAPTYPIITITNNSSNTSLILVENLTTRQVFKYTGTLATGQDLVIKAQTLEVINNSVGDLGNAQDEIAMQLFPEDNEIQITGIVSGVITLDWFDQWL